MTHEKERELLEKFQDYWNGECYDDTILPSHIDSFLSTLPEEKEEKTEKIQVIIDNLHKQYEHESKEECWVYAKHHGCIHGCGNDVCIHHPNNR